jgi:hypothetical protein
LKTTRFDFHKKKSARIGNWTRETDFQSQMRLPLHYESIQDLWVYVFGFRLNIFF